MALLTEAGDVAGLPWELVTDLSAKPAAIHAGLSDAKNRLRASERAGEFGPAFVATARAIIAATASAPASNARSTPPFDPCSSRKDYG
jgi:flavin reductase (DIM6/NTAB) family NADH-FMN oxidoreductase RutF